MLRILTRLLFLLIIAAIPSYASVLDDLAAPRSYHNGRISSYDKSGGNNDGSQSERVKAGEIRTIAKIDGPGKITHFWFTMFAGQNMDLLRDVILRMYWDGEKTPSVEVPIGEFFGLGHGKYYTFSSLPIEIGNDKGLNCFFPMPFRKSAKVTIENQGKEEIGDFYYYVDYVTYDKPDLEPLYFHAQYRQGKPVLTRDNYTILDAKGRGHYVGCFLFARSNEGGWWGEGDDMIYIDGAKEPTLHGTGVEDYFCHSWGFAKDTYALRFGAPLTGSWSEGGENAVYRFHIEDPIAFKTSFKMTMEHAYGGHNDRADDWSTVAYWYQTEPHAAFPTLPPPDRRRSMAEQLKMYSDWNRLGDYRALLSKVLEDSTSGHVRRTTGNQLFESYKSAGDTQKAIETLLRLAGPFPDNATAEATAAKIKELGGDPSLVPQFHAWPTANLDGHIQNVFVDGKVCARSYRAIGSPYLYFRVVDKALRSGDRPVTIELEYYDDGKQGDTFWIEYDSAFSDSEADKYRPSAKQVKSGRKGWRKADFQLDRARFGQRQNGAADFRITGDGNVYVREIKITGQ